MKAIVLAGGSGTRLHPMTHAVSKQALPIYDKPMIYYPLSVLMLAGLRHILVISTPRDLPMFQDMLGSGDRFGLTLDYAVQPEPGGLAQAFLIGDAFLDQGPACLILGDNVFYSHGLPSMLRKSAQLARGAQVYASYVPDPERYGIVSFDGAGTVTGVEEKPVNPQSNWAITGLYFYDSKVTDFAKTLTPSTRGELEITDINRMYLERGELEVEKMGRGYAWFDTGTPDSLHDAASFVQAISRRQSYKIACLEEIAMQNGWISPQETLANLPGGGKGDYAAYVRRRAEEIAHG